MSEDSSTGSSDPAEPTRPLEGLEHTTSLESFETVGPPGSGEGGSHRRTVIAAVAAVVLALLGGGAYAAYSFLDGGGPQPADVLPASTVAVVSVDLDPSAGQKIAAIKSIRRFPALKETLGLHADDDLREYVLDKLVADSHCTGLDFDKDVKPWLGKRAAFAGVDLGGDTPVPAIALQVSDATAAKKGFDAIVECADPEDFAFVVGEDYLIASDSAEHAQAILAKGRQKPLADEAAYRKWTDAAGDSGVVNFFVGKRAAGYADDLLDEFSSGFTAGVGGRGPAEGPNVDSFSDDELAGTGPQLQGDPFGSARDLLHDFQGLGGTVRFADGGMELSVAGGGIGQFENVAPIGDQIGDLPADTAAALGLGIGDGYAKQLIDQLEAGFDVGSDDFLADTEEQTGLNLPEDLQTLLGDGVVLSLGADAPRSMDSVDSPEDVPAGLLIHGDPDKIKAVITRIEDHVGRHLSDVPIVVESARDKLALATSHDYADALLEDGSLGSAGRFRDAVPDADKASGVFYVDFDSQWRDLLADLIGEQQGSGTRHDAEENVAPLRGLGISSWEDGDVSHALFKVTSD